MAEFTCFVAGIVKGVIEHQDATRHFGSLMAFKAHLADAIDLGLVADEDTVTALGRRVYQDSDLAAAPDCRAYFWDRKFVDAGREALARQ